MRNRFGTLVPASGRARTGNLRASLRVEQLEPRNLLSANPIESLVAHPAVEFVPLAFNSRQVGLTPAQVRHAYGFDRTTFYGVIAGDGTGQTIAIVDAFDHPNILTDLQAFDRTLGLPDPPAFQKATPQGTPSVDGGWALEIALDVEWAHALAPGANILLVEAKNDSLSSLLKAVDYARNQPGVSVVSTSWGGGEFAAETYYDAFFTTPTNHAAVSFVASSGDNGAFAGVSWPAISPNVLAVGGTLIGLTPTGDYYAEAAWSGSGGGGSFYEWEPAYQFGAQRYYVRTNPDVAAIGDPRTGLAVFSTVSDGTPGWARIGGTSASAPLWAGLIAVADQGRAFAGKGPLVNVQAMVYGLPATDFHDEIWGSNGFYAAPGYDLATGRGSPVADRIVAHLVAAGSPVPPPPSTPGGTAAGAVKVIYRVNSLSDISAPILPLSAQKADVANDSASREERPAASVADVYWTRNQWGKGLNDVFAGAQGNDGSSSFIGSDDARVEGKLKDGDWSGVVNDLLEELA